MQVRAIVWCIIFVCWGTAVWGQSEDIHPLLPSRQPDRIVLNATEDLRHSASVTWRTSVDVGESYAEIALADPNPQFVQKAKRQVSSRQIVKHGEFAAQYHSVSFKDLQPNTLYAYRVGQGESWSEWFQFRTAGTSGKTSLIYFGDVQAGILPYWSRVVREAYKRVPDASAMLYAGDLVNRGNRDVEWGEWFLAGGFIHASVPVIPTPGNHDHGDDDKGNYTISKYWQAQFELPKNGPQGYPDMAESCYFVDIDQVRIVTINTEFFDERKDIRKTQIGWVEKVLASNSQRWTILLLHHPIYSTKKNRDNEELRNALKPLIDKYRVDLVLQGHDHTYVRGMQKVPMEKGMESGTAYVVSVSGPKLSEVLVADWMDKTAQFMQLFHAVHVDDQRLIFETYTSAGELFDRFELHKQAGRVNRFVD